MRPITLQPLQWTVRIGGGEPTDLLLLGGGSAGRRRRATGRPAGRGSTATRRRRRPRHGRVGVRAEHAQDLGEYGQVVRRRRRRRRVVLVVHRRQSRRAGRPRSNCGQRLGLNQHPAQSQHRSVILYQQTGGASSNVQAENSRHPV